MFSISPFILDYQRPKSYALFDDDYYPFSRNRYYVEQQAPSPFGRSFSFRRPSSAAYCPASFCQPAAASFHQSKPERPPKNESDDELNDPFLDLFGLRPQSKTAAKDRTFNRTCNQQEAKRTCTNQKEANQICGQKETKKQRDQPASEEPRESPKKLKCSEEKVLDSQRYDTESEIEFRFGNYKCTDPAGIQVRITKENYIELRTADGYAWKSRLADNVGDLQKASCTLSNGVLSLKLPKRVQQPAVDNGEQREDSKKEQPEAKKVEPEKVQPEKVADEEFDPDAPIVEDIIEEME